MFPVGRRNLSGFVVAVLLLIAMLCPRFPQVSAATLDSSDQPTMLRLVRTSPGDLEVSGELAGLPVGTVRYIRYEDLLSLPQETYPVADDGNFNGKTEISGVPLASLARLFGQAAHSDLIVAICYDKYRANYPSRYIADHHPLLVLRINGKLREEWPKSEDGGPLGPYLISHPKFVPAFKILAHSDEPQVPYGVTRLEFRTESVVFGTIQPPGKWAEDSPVWQGYRIAQQDCFRCHSLNGEGGERASRSWLVLAAWAATDAARFTQYIHNPQSVQTCSRMPAHSTYDEATLAALTAYFRTFSFSPNNLRTTP